MGCHTWFYSNKVNFEKQLTCEFHDVFRTSDYDGAELYSLKETIDYISDEKNGCLIMENTVELLNEFWDKYPEGVIEFG
jgi:hypothetical protein